jgi:hypothetical protein
MAYAFIGVMLNLFFLAPVVFIYDGIQTKQKKKILFWLAFLVLISWVVIK